MFTGIVEETGRVVSFHSEAEAWELVIAADKVRQDAALGDSIAINGCCLTIARQIAGQLHFDVLEGVEKRGRKKGSWGRKKLTWGGQADAEAQADYRYVHQ